MKKFTVFFCQEVKNEENGEVTKQFGENVVFADTAKEVKELPGYRSIVKSDYVSHPTPAAMQGAVQYFASNPTEVLSLASFYTMCEAAQVELDKIEMELVASGDEKAIKREERRQEQKRIAEENAKKREDNKVKEATKKALEEKKAAKDKK